MKSMSLLLALALFASAAAEAACTTPSLQTLPAVPIGNVVPTGVGDVNRDGYPDLVASLPLENEIHVRVGNGDGTFQPAVVYAAEQPERIAVEDVNKDDWGDLLYISRTGLLAVRLNNGDGTFGAAVTWFHSFGYVSHFEGGDADNDGDRDILVTDSKGARVLINSGSGGFPTGYLRNPGGEPAGSVLADLNNDGRLDIAVAYSGNQTQSAGLKIYLNGGQAIPRFPESPSFTYTFPAGAAPTGLAKGDFNRDNRPDLAVSLWDGFRTYLGSSSGTGALNNGMSMTLSSSNGINFDDVTVADFNEDGADDMAFASNGGSDLYVIVGLGNGNFQTPPYAKPIDSGASTSIGHADVDRDGRMDIFRWENAGYAMTIFRNDCAVRYTTAAVASSQNPAAYGTAVTFTATVSTRPNGPMPTGSVALYVNGVQKESKTLSGGTATFTAIPNLAVGHHAVRVEYTATGEFANATSPSLSQEITRPPFGAPLAFQAFRYGPSTTAVHMTWIGVQGASEYEVFRMHNGTWSSIGTTIGEDFADLMVPDANPQVYAVRALRTGDTPSAMTAPDIATTFLYSTANLSGAPLRAADVTELRTLINGLRTRTGLAAVSFTDATLTTARAVHVTELRTALQQALSALGLMTPTYSQPVIAAGTSVVRAADFQELRNVIY